MRIEILTIANKLLTMVYKLLLAHHHSIYFHYLLLEILQCHIVRNIMNGCSCIVNSLNVQSERSGGHCVGDGFV